ncbi:MAG TPA: T9SS type A sorting domain-containing protein [Chitinivibrionales bacterium]|nr:T9SS type A sorting domain-containing protein [Chitinivibrionales bacterium]
MKNPIVLVVFFLWQAAFGLQAPYLFSADSVADTAVQLTWRNNSVDYQGIIILRKTVAAGTYEAIDTAPGTATSFTDAVRPTAQTTYYYALTAYSLTEHADTSNGDSASITPKSTIVFVSPQNLSVFYDTLTHIVHVQFYDSSTVELGYKIYKSANFAAFEMIKDIVSSTRSQKGVISYTDSAVSPNTWYQYYALTYNNQQGLSSNVDTLFTFDLDAMARSIPRKCSLSNKLSSFPINYKGWSLKFGDTIVLNETGAPDSTTFSIINVSNPSALIFAGTGKSPAAMLGKASLSKGPNIIGNEGPNMDSLVRYKYSSGEIHVVSGIMIPQLPSDFRYPATYFPGFISDSVFITMGSINFGFGDWVTMAARYSINNNIISFIDTTALDGYTVLNNKIYNGRYFFNAISPGNFLSTDSIVEIIDFNYSPKVKTIIRVSGQIEFPIIADGIFIDAPVLKSAKNIFIDTVKNLAFALSDMELEVYNCQITTGTTQNIFSRHLSTPSLRIGQEPGNSICIIFLPRHFHPADVSIYTMSGRLAYRFSNVSDESINWRRGNKTGVYLIKAVIDGQTFSAKTILTK